MTAGIEPDRPARPLLARVEGEGVKRAEGVGRVQRPRGAIDDRRSGHAVAVELLAIVGELPELDVPEDAAGVGDGVDRPGRGGGVDGRPARPRSAADDERLGGDAAGKLDRPADSRRTGDAASGRAASSWIVSEGEPARHRRRRLDQTGRSERSGDQSPDHRCLAGRCGRPGELAAQPDEQGLESEARVQVELLQRAPGVADELGRPLGAGRALSGGVLAQYVEAVVVDDRAFGARVDYDEVAVPRRELLEREQQLLALGPALRAPDALLRLARGKLEPLEPTLGR